VNRSRDESLDVALDPRGILGVRDGGLNHLLKGPPSALRLVWRLGSKEHGNPAAPAACVSPQETLANYNVGQAFWPVRRAYEM